MPLSYRIVCSCLLALLFFIMLAVKLDRKTDWNWFLVCFPLWIFDAMFLTLLIFRLVTNLRNASNRDISASSLMWKGLFIFGLAMKACFEIMLCVKLQYADDQLSTFYVFIPLWILLLLAMVRLFPWAGNISDVLRKRGSQPKDTTITSRSTQSVKRGPTTSGLSNTVGAHPRSVGSRSSNSS